MSNNSFMGVKRPVRRTSRAPGDSGRRPPGKIYKSDARADSGRAEITRSRLLLLQYAGLTLLAMALELGVLGWVAARVAAFARSEQAAEMQEVLATREHLAPLLQHLARWHPLPERLRGIMQVPPSLRTLSPARSLPGRETGLGRDRHWRTASACLSFPARESPEARLGC